MSDPSRRSVLIGIFLLTLVLHLAVAWQDFSVLVRNGFLYDDSFYAFKIAQNIATGAGATFDGTTSTNGFQPLYVFLLVPVYWVTGSDLIAPVYAALTMSALLAALTAVLLFKITRRCVGVGIAATTAVVWACSPVVLRQTANGLETALAVFLMAASVYYYLSRIRSNTDPRARDFALLGLLLGLAVLARIDQIFLALVMLLDYLIALRRRGVPARGAVKVMTAVIAAVLVYSPWLVFCSVQTGSMFQDSGSATRYLSMAYAPFFEVGPADVVDGPSGEFVWSHVVRSVAVLKVAPPVYAFFRLFKRADSFLGLSGGGEIVGNVVGLLLLAAFLYLALFRRKDPIVEKFAELRFLLLFSVVLMAAYAFYIFGVFFFLRYLYPVFFVVSIYLALVLALLFRRLGRSSAPVRAVGVGLLAAYALTYGYLVYSGTYRSQPMYHFYDVAKWVQENTSRGDTIGVFQGGAIGYLSDRRVINLDGKVNRDALHALKNRTLAEYLEREGVDIVMDNSDVLDLFLGRAGIGPGQTNRYQKIMDGIRDGVPGWAGYRIDRSVGDAGRSSPPMTPSGTH